MHTPVSRSLVLFLRSGATTALSVVALLAILGGAALALDPSGRLLALDVALLRGTPFETYRVPGLVLLFVIGGSSTAAFLVQGGSRPGLATLGAGATLFWWMFVQILLIGLRSPIQPFLLFVAIALQIVGLLVQLLDERPTEISAAPQQTAVARGVARPAEAV